MRLFPILADVVWSPWDIAAEWLVRIIPVVLILAVVVVTAILIRRRRK